MMHFKLYSRELKKPGLAYASTPHQRVAAVGAARWRGTLSHSMTSTHELFGALLEYVALEGCSAKATLLPREWCRFINAVLPTGLRRWCPCLWRSYAQLVLMRRFQGVELLCVRPPSLEPGSSSGVATPAVPSTFGYQALAQATCAGPLPCAVDVDNCDVCDESKGSDQQDPCSDLVPAAYLGLDECHNAEEKHHELDKAEHLLKHIVQIVDVRVVKHVGDQNYDNGRKCTH